jgi:uncharacterized protein with PQ loop repeat
LRHRTLGGVSAISWLITTAACFTWLLYGVKGHVWPQVPGNALIIPCAAAIVLTVPARLTVPRRAVLLAAIAAALIVTALLVRPDELGYLAFVISLVAATPQAVKSVVQRGAGRSAVSVPAWLMRGGSQVFWLYYALVLHNGPTAVASVVTMFSTAVVITIESARLISARLAQRQASPLPQAGGPT